MATLLKKNTLNSKRNEGFELDLSYKPSVKSVNVDIINKTLTLLLCIIKSVLINLNLRIAANL